MPRVAVLGAGMFGAAAARHLSRAGFETVAIGPGEPGDRAAHPGPFAAHYDEARILVARGTVAEQRLTRLTIAGMLELERATGEDRFVVASGAVEVSPAPVARRTTAVPPQGYFNPRRYIAAALADVTAHGGRVVRETVSGWSRRGDSFEVRTPAGTHVADRVVIAAGAWCNGLLRRPVAIRLKREHVLFAEVTESAGAALSQPTVWHGTVGRVADVYLLPPLRYPDGRRYVKIGANTVHDREVPPAAIDEWYRRGDADVARADLVEALFEMCPDLPVLGFHTDRCVVTYSVHGRPYIDELDEPGAFIATAGNGHGASWADGVGQCMAALVRGEPWEGLNRSDFAAVYADESPEWPQPWLLKDG